MNSVEWLPDLVCLEDYGGNWHKYLEVLYDFYKEDFINSKPVFRGKRLWVKKHPLLNGKEVTFWHIIQEGENEDERIPDLRRCVRIRWSKPIVEHSEGSEIRVWDNERHTKKGVQRNICIWFEQVEYLVVLRKRTGYILFWTGYPVTEKHRKWKLEKEYQRYKNKQAPPVKDDAVTPSTHGR